MHDDVTQPSRRAFLAAASVGPWVLLVGARVVKAEAPRRAPSRRTSGARRIDLELQDADIRDVLELFAEIGKVSIVTERGIPNKKVTARLVGVPWDEALAGILRSVGLGMIREGSVVYVVSSTR